MNVSASVCRFAAKEKSLKNGNEKKRFREKKVLGAGSGIIHGGADVEPDQLLLRPNIIDFEVELSEFALKDIR